DASLGSWRPHVIDGHIAVAGHLQVLRHVLRADPASLDHFVVGAGVCPAVAGHFQLGASSVECALDVKSTVAGNLYVFRSIATLPEDQPRIRTARERSQTDITVG